jgi:hypothetical protein
LHDVSRKVLVANNRPGGAQEPGKVTPVQRLQLNDAGAGSPHYSYDAETPSLV